MTAVGAAIAAVDGKKLVENVKSEELLGQADELLRQANESYDRKEYNRTIDCCTDLLNSDEHPQHAFNLRGCAYYEQGNYDLAIAEFTKAIAAQGNFHLSTFYANRGEAYLKKGMYDHAIEDLTTAVKVYPDFDSAKKLLAEALRCNRREK